MKWYEIKAKQDIAEIYLYDEIGGWGIPAKQFVDELKAVKSSRIELHINSPGGGVFDGIAIYNVLKAHPATITTYIDGLAASIASVIALAGETVIMAENALFMMHNPTGLTVGSAEDMRKMAAALDKIRDLLIGTYVAKSGQSEAEIAALLDAETWMNAEEAFDAGFVDQIGDEMDMAACIEFAPAMAKLGFKHVPETLTGEKKNPSKRNLEHALRDAGCSPSQAKSILAKGYQSDSLRDEEPPQEDPPGPEPPRDVELPAPAKKDRVSDLLTRAEVIAPSMA